MAQGPRPVTIHSFGEAYLYARVTPCVVCAGPLDADEARFEHDAEAGLLKLEAACRRCAAPFEREFEVAEVAAADFALLRGERLAGPWELESPSLNPTDDASRVIDVAGWLAAFALVNDQARTAGERAGGAGERSEARRMRLVAGACLEEALKFFEDDNDLPPDDAFFRDETRRQFWERPELFTRQYIAELRLALGRAAPER